MNDRAPDLIGPLMGWRAWDVARTREGWRLHSVHMGDSWPVEAPLAAECHRARWVAGSVVATHEGHEAPAPGCQCGVYGAVDAARARQYFVANWAEADGLPQRRLDDDYVPRAVGHVQLWGRVIECTQGYRASHAYPGKIWLPARRPDGVPFDVESVAFDLLDYGVSVELLDVGTRAELIDRLPYEQAA
jgi:hypothetical protein